MGEDNSRSGTINRYGHSLASALQRNKAFRRIDADGKRQASEVAWADFGVAARPKCIQATIQLFGEVQRFVVGHVTALRFLLN